MQAVAVRVWGGHDGLQHPADLRVLTERPAGVLPAGQACEAHPRVTVGGVRGRLVVDVIG